MLADAYATLMLLSIAAMPLSLLRFDAAIRCR